MYYLYCNKCNNLFNPEYANKDVNVCPLSECNANSLVELDELIAYSIKELNVLGYITDCCCSGHISDIKNNYFGGYILFDKYYALIEDIVNKYLSHNLIFKHFDNGIKSELRWELRFKDEYIENNINIPPDYRLITEFIDAINQLIHHLKTNKTLV